MNKKTRQFKNENFSFSKFFVCFAKISNKKELNRMRQKSKRINF